MKDGGSCDAFDLRVQRRGQIPERQSSLSTHEFCKRFFDGFYLESDTRKSPET